MTEVSTFWRTMIHSPWCPRRTYPLLQVILSQIHPFFVSSWPDFFFLFNFSFWEGLYLWAWVSQLTFLIVSPRGKSLVFIHSVAVLLCALPGVVLWKYSPWASRSCATWSLTWLLPNRKLNVRSCILQMRLNQVRLTLFVLACCFQCAAAANSWPAFLHVSRTQNPGCVQTFLPYLC